MGCIGMYGPNGYGFSAVLVINLASILPRFCYFAAMILVLNRVSILHFGFEFVGLILLPLFHSSTGVKLTL